MTTEILINVVLAVAIMTVIVGTVVWAVRTQHHDEPLAERAILHHRIKIVRSHAPQGEREPAAGFPRPQTA